MPEKKVTTCIQILDNTIITVNVQVKGNKYNETHVQRGSSNYYFDIDSVGICPMHIQFAVAQ
jgi:hypothetical protein